MSDQPYASPDGQRTDVRRPRGELLGVGRWALGVRVIACEFLQVRKLMTHSSPSHSASSLPRSLKDLQKACDEIAHSDAGDTHKIASLMQQMSLDYYADVRKQAQQSFSSALVAASIGTLFFLYAVWLGMASDNRAWISIIAGALVQVISAINFYLYGRAAHQFATFHICLERTNRFLLANTLCEKLGSPLQDQVRKDLIQIVASAPMLTLDIVEGRKSREHTLQDGDSA